MDIQEVQGILMNNKSHRGHGCLENHGSSGRANRGRGGGGDGGERGGSSWDTRDDSRESQSHSQPSRGGRYGGSESSTSKDGDLLSHAASALRRLHFKSAGGSRSCHTVPKVVVMGSSTASETTINTSTDSANTMVTLVTTTDGEQQDDSFDLIDVPLETSPPPVAQTSKDTHNNSFGMQQTVRRSKKLNSNHVEHYSKNTTDLHLTITIPHDTMFEINDIDDMESPPPTPMIGPDQEPKFTFARGRTPPLPDLRTAEFFSTPVRGSVDAGQPSQITKEIYIDKSGSVKIQSNHTSITILTCDKNYTETKHSAGQKPHINVTTNPLDISLVGGQPSCNVDTPTGTTNRNRGRSTTDLMDSMGSRISRLAIPLEGHDSLLHISPRRRRFSGNVRRKPDQMTSATILSTSWKFKELSYRPPFS
ncbi:hypothetical protein M0802_000902 [Mischocyttarus mexicanus]|nr:hypothetical protein M0802_000902 [Mischocyttarus mexicanus]